MSRRLRLGEQTKDSMKYLTERPTVCADLPPANTPLARTLSHGPARVGLLCIVSLVMVMSACTSRTRGNAPVEDRGIASTRPAPVGLDGTTPPIVLPGAENAGKPGYYTVRPGDTLIRIGLDTGQNWRDIARWSNLENPNTIEVGQVLRVVPPLEAQAVVVKPVISAPGTTATALPPAGSSAPAPSPPPAQTAAAPVAAASAPRAVASEDDIAWIWPAQGALLASFDEAKNKGFDIAGKNGDPIIASADGRVVYAGAGLRGYGNLVILKHNNTFLTAYAHNQTLFVKEDQTVKKGQKIAEMGNSDSDRVKLHFEIRRQGKPVDPSRYLPARP